VSGSGISWAICKSAPCSRQTTTPAPRHSVFYRSDALPVAQPTVSKHWRCKKRKSLQVLRPLKSVMYGQLHCQLTSTKLYCLVTGHKVWTACPESSCCDCESNLLSASICYKCWKLLLKVTGFIKSADLDLIYGLWREFFVAENGHNSTGNNAV